MTLEPNARRVLEALYDDPGSPRNGQDARSPLARFGVDDVDFPEAAEELVAYGLATQPLQWTIRITARGRREVEEWRSLSGRMRNSRISRAVGALDEIAAVVLERTGNLVKVGAWILSAVGAGALLSC